MKRLIGFVIVLSCVCGCETSPKPVARIPFPQAEYAALPKTGTGIVRGQVFMRTRGGDVKTGAGLEVVLNPVTSYSQQWYEVQYKATQGALIQKIENPDPRLAQYRRETTADAEGRFEFKNVPPGDYFVVGLVVWEAPSSSQGSHVTQGGWIAKQITVKDGEEQHVILTR
jgi:hypothetical protein